MLPRALPFLLAPLLPASLLAEETPRPEPRGPRLPALSVLLPPTELQGVMIPRYDDHRRLTSLVRAEMLTLIDKETVEGKNLQIELFNEDGTSRARTEVAEALLDQVAGLLTSQGRLVAEFGSAAQRVHVEARGIIYSLDSGKIFLAGPTTTRIQHPPQTAMNLPKPLQQAVAAGALLASAATHAAPPPSLTAGEKQALEADAVSVAPAAEEAREAARAEVRDALQASLEVGRSMNSFLEEAAERNLATGSETPVVVHEPATEPHPVQTEVGQTLITSSNGLYLDPKEGVAVFLGDVKVEDPRLTLTGANELKVFFEKRAADPKPAEGEAEEKGLGSAFSSFGEVSRIVASGRLQIEARPEKGEPMQVGGALLTYNLATDQLVLRGGHPYLISKSRGQLRAQETNATLRVNLKTGEGVGDGVWTTGLDVKGLQNR